MNPRRTRLLLRVAFVCAGLLSIFLSGVLPVEDHLGEVPSFDLSASVVPAKVAQLTNKSREEVGLKPLTVNPLLTQAAQLKAEDMANNSYYAHVSPDGKGMLHWLQLVGYKYLNAGENLVIDRDTSEAAVDAWMQSQTHRQNILRPQFTEIGVGVARGRYKGQDTIYVVQQFGTPYPLATSKPTAPAAVTVPKSAPAPQVRRPVATEPTRPTPAPSPTTPTDSTAASTTPARTMVTPTLTVASLPPTSIVNDVNTIATPIIRALTPVVKKAVAPAAVTRPGATSTDPRRASPTIATSSFAYALSPEFFAPVTYTAPLEGSTTIQAPRGQGGRGMTLGGPALPAEEIARPTVLSKIIPETTQLLSQIALFMRILLP